MNIDSRVPAISREVQINVPASDAASRQRSDTSSPSGDSTREPVVTQNVKFVIAGARGSQETYQSPIDVQKAVEKLNNIVRSQKKDVSFTVDKDANATVIKFFKSQTGELIKQFPPEEILAMIARLRKNIGWLVDKKA